MSEDITAVFFNGCQALHDNWLDELKRQTQALLVDLPPVPRMPLFSGSCSYAASEAHEQYAKSKADWYSIDLSRLKPHLIRIPDDIDHPRRYSGNSHQRRKQRRAQRSHR